MVSSQGELLTHLPARLQMEVKSKTFWAAIGLLYVQAPANRPSTLQQAPQPAFHWQDLALALSTATLPPGALPGGQGDMKDHFVKAPEKHPPDGTLGCSAEATPLYKPPLQLAKSSCIAIR